MSAKYLCKRKVEIAIFHMLKIKSDSLKKVFLCFLGVTPEINFHLVFSLTNKSNRQFEMGIEKIEYLVDILPMQLGTLPDNIEEITYSYDEATFKWNPHIASSNGGLQYVFNNKTGWTRLV